MAEGIYMTEDQREIRRKKRVIDYAEENGNIRISCRRLGIALPIRFAQPCRRALPWVSARPAAVGRGEGPPLEHSRFDPSPRPTAAPPCQRQAPIASPCEQRTRTLRTRFSALNTPRPESGRGRSDCVRAEIPPRLRPRAREHRSRKRRLLWGVCRHGGANRANAVLARG